jgi:RecA-family ATPase
MKEEKEMTARMDSVGAESGQSSQLCSDKSIAGFEPEINDKFRKLDKLYRKIQQINDPAYLPVVTMNDLFENIYPSRPAIIDNLLYPGIYIFAGSPKVGKSFLMAQLAYHVSTGQPLWGYDVRQGAVLYLALEDVHRRLQDRLYRMFGTDGTDDLYLSVYAKQLGNGLEDQLKFFLREHPNTRLIIIDTLQKIRDDGGDKYNYGEDYGTVNALKKIADENGICLLVVHHTRKLKAEDIFEMISGTTGLYGASDGAFVLTKEKHSSPIATLDVTGRDQPDQQLCLKRNMERLVWELERVETELWLEPPDPVLDAIAALVTADAPAWSGTATELISSLNLDMKPNALAMRLNVRASKLANDYNIHYESTRTHAGRNIKLALIEPQA